MTQNTGPKRRPIDRSDGINSSERYLKSLCDHSFLSLWSYSSVYRAPGQELCDLLVVFEDHIIVFSDKDCDFPNTGKLQLDWNRWFKKAVEKSAQQLWGAERWIRQYPDRIFLNPQATKPFPLSLPNPQNATIHRVLVAHGASKRCKQALGGSGSLMI